MAKIVFFCIPAQEHTNPTLGVVRELVRRGHQVWYYSYRILQKQIEAAGAVPALQGRRTKSYRSADTRKHKNRDAVHTAASLFCYALPFGPVSPTFRLCSAPTVGSAQE